MENCSRTVFAKSIEEVDEAMKGYGFLSAVNLSFVLGSDQNLPISC